MKVIFRRHKGRLMHRLFHLRQSLVSIGPSRIVLGFIMMGINSSSPFQSAENAPEMAHRFSAYENSITFIGHSTTMIHLNDLNIITDPIYSDRLLVFKRQTNPGIHFDDLPEVNAILISHEHLDHLNIPTLKMFDRSISVLIPKGLGKKVKSLGFLDVRELTQWESTWVQGIEITAVPVKHTETSLGYMIKGFRNIFYTGDTGLFDGFRDIAQRFEVDIALLPIGCYYPFFSFGPVKWLRDTHLAPDDIPSVVEMLQPKIVIPHHYGTFSIGGKCMEVPVQEMKGIIDEGNLESKVFLINHGERFNIDEFITSK